jgi:hypothetical protein
VTFGMEGAMRRKGDGRDTAVTETRFGSLKVERRREMRVATRRQAKPFDRLMHGMTRAQWIILARMERRKRTPDNWPAIGALHHLGKSPWKIALT